MRLALAQINPVVGDLEHNADLIARFAQRARQQRADLVVFPELALTGYPPRDLLLRAGFLSAVMKKARALGQAASEGLTLVFGTPLQDLSGAAPTVTNSLLVYTEGEMIAYYDKRLLPNYDVFDEQRYFAAGTEAMVLPVADLRVGLSLCEDLWRGEDVGLTGRYADLPDPVVDLVSPLHGEPGAQLILNASASPFFIGKGRSHRRILGAHARKHGVLVASVNQVGANDELIFDGHAAVFDATGALIGAAPGFVEHLLVCDLAPPPARGAAGAGGGGIEVIDARTRSVVPLAGGGAGSPRVPDPVLAATDTELLFRALVLGVRDYCRKTGFKTAVLGLSGGIDSAVTAVIAAAALGPANVTALSMPSRYSSPGSKDDAAALAECLGIEMRTVPIEEPFAAFERVLAPVFEGKQPGLAQENLQSRIRGTLLMAHSNACGSILLTTGNKSELAVGYCTLYGDMNGGLAVLADTTKHHVYRLAEWINAHAADLGLPRPPSWPPIPRSTLTKPPSAELRPNQTDQDSLPPYDVLDAIIDRYVDRHEDPRRIVAEGGIDAATVARVVRMIDLAEYKRKQAPIGLKVTPVAFGSGRRMPIAQGYRADKGL
ncbi:MAG: NAD+ synthase [Phycisphaerae bacterium]|nr:NAD+ synthase [Phycisphaerae bacterium]